MKARVAIVVALLAALIALVALNLHERHALATADAERGATEAQLAAVTREEQSTARLIADARARRDALRKSVAISPVPRPVRMGVNPLDPRAREAAVANNFELRNLRVQAFVGERRVTFAGFLHQLRLSPEELKRFDDIQAEFEQASLDLVSTARAQGITNPADLGPLRREISATYHARLQELFGDNYEAWQEAVRGQGAQAAVDDLLQQTLQSGGPLDPTQAQALVAIVQRHAQPRTTTGYDWGAIAADAATVLSGPTLDSVRTALAERALTEKIKAGGWR